MTFGRIYKSVVVVAWAMTLIGMLATAIALNGPWQQFAETMWFGSLAVAVSLTVIALLVYALADIWGRL